MLAAALASLWGFRLGGYLLVDRVLGKQEDGRYRALRATWEQSANRNFFWFFEAQALFVVFFSLPFAFIAQNGASGLDALEWIGIAVWAVGNVGTIVADRQLAAGAQTRPTRERLHAAASGAGRATRTTSSSSRPGAEPRSSRARRRGGWLAWLVPAGLLYLLFRVTGIPATEAQALRSTRLPTISERRASSSRCRRAAPRRAQPRAELLRPRRDAGRILTREARAAHGVLGQLRRLPAPSTER